MQLVILGGGFTGAALVLHLARHVNASAIGTVHVVEPAPVLGLGLAYSTPFASHLLNVRHMNMSVFDDDRGHFSAWLQGHRPPDAEEYVERRLYGRYVQDCLQKQLARPPTVKHVRGRAVDIEPPTAERPARVHLDTGAWVEGSRVALCLGNTAAHPTNLAHLLAQSSPCAILEPWRWDTLQHLPRSGHVFLLGTGLTMVDTVLALYERGFDGSITAMSRHGLCPRPHLAHTEPQPPLALPTPPTAINLTRTVRAAASQGVPSWQPVLDSLRAGTPALWHALSMSERQRYLRHVKPFWDVHRHRIAPAVHERIQSLIAGGQLTLCAGRLLDAQRDGDGLELRIRRRGSSTPVRQKVDCLVNCTGLTVDWRVPHDPIVQALQRRGLMQADPLGLGIVADAEGAVHDAQGRPSPWLVALGGALVGRDFESIAVPELRHQARCVAAHWLDKVELMQS